MMATTRGTLAELAGLARYGELPSTLTVDVTKLDLFFGIRESANYCPIASALKRMLTALGLNCYVDVDAYHVAVLPQGNPLAEWIEFSHNAASFVRAFDDGRRVSPCTVTLRRAAA